MEHGAWNAVNNAALEQENILYINQTKIKLFWTLRQLVGKVNIYCIKHHTENILNQVDEMKHFVEKIRAPTFEIVFVDGRLRRGEISHVRWIKDVHERNCIAIRGHCTTIK